MKRLPRGGAKVNYTLYLTKDERDMIKQRAADLEMSNSYYIMKLYEMDSQIGLLEHVEEGGTIGLLGGSAEEVSEQKPEVSPIKPGEMPAPDHVQAIQKEFQKNVEAGQEVEQQAEAPKTAQAPGTPSRFQRPRMRSLAETVAAQSGVNIHAGTTGDMRNPGMSPAELRATQQLDHQNWQDKLHHELQQGESGDKRIRKEILDNLPPEEKADEEA